MKKVVLLILNFVLPCVLLAMSWDNEVKRWGGELLGGVIVITYLIFFAVYGEAYRHGRSRLLYEGVIFVGMILYLIVLYKSIDLFGISTDFSELGIGTKISLTFVCILIMIMRIVTMVAGNDKYRAESMDRQVRRVESAVEDARIKVKVAADNGSLHDIEKAKIELEEAKERRSGFYDEVKRGQSREYNSDTHRKKQSWEE